MPYSQSRMEHVYAVEEVTFGVAQPPTATDAFRVANPGPTMKADQASVRANEKTGSRSQSPSLRCGSIAGTITVPLFVEPSGTPGTPPDGKALYKNLMGKETIISTTVTSAASASSITLASATGVKAGTILGIGADMRPVGSIAGNVATMAVPFPSTPAGASAVKAVNYELQDPLPSTLSVYSYIQQWPHVSVGSVFNQGVFSFVDEVLHLELTGIDTDVLDTAIPAEPTPVYSGFPLARGCGKVFIAGVAASVLEFTVTINNGDEARQIPVGSQTTSGISRGLRVVTDTFTVYLTDVTKDYYAIAKARTNQPLFVQIGDIAGKLFSIWLPQRTLKTPDLDKTPPEIQMQFAGEAYGYAAEEMVIAFG